MTRATKKQVVKQKTQPVDNAPVRELAAALGISGKQANLLIALRSKPGEWMTRLELEEVLGARVYGQDVKLLWLLTGRGLVAIDKGVRGAMMPVNIFKAL